MLLPIFDKRIQPMSNRTTRRNLLGLTGAGLLGPALAAQQEQKTVTAGPDLVVLNARVITVDSRQTRAKAVAIKHGRFLAVASNANVSNVIGQGTSTSDPLVA